MKYSWIIAALLPVLFAGCATPKGFEQPGFAFGCPIGDAVITCGGNVKARHVIHAVGPVWRGGDEHEPCRVRVRRFLAVLTPQLLLSSACAIVLTMKASPTAVFPHRGLAPDQFTPMSGAHEALHRTRILLSANFIRLAHGSLSARR